MGKQVLQMYYHPAKKEILFKRIVAGQEIPIKSDSKLYKYMNERGKFVLQDHGNSFFADITETFDGEKSIALEIVTTKMDFEDFQQMLEYYNQNSGVQISATLLAELPDMKEAYTLVKEHGEKCIGILRSHKNTFFDGIGDIMQVKACVEGFAADVQIAVNGIQEKIDSLKDNSINLCFTGVYSAGKSALINSILGFQILPENISSATARMFKIQSPKAGECIRIIFSICDNYAELLWSEKSGTFEFVAAPNENPARKEIQETINVHQGNLRHQQIYEILKTLNGHEDVDTSIQIFFPIPLDSEQVQFTIFDTPGTDSNYLEHQSVLKDALSEQTHSILVFVLAPTKTEGTGNNTLLSYLKESEEKDQKSSIDIGRSLFVINWADSIGPDERSALQSAKITNKADDSFSIKLADKKLFFTSAKIAYAAKAKYNNIATKAEEFTIKKEIGTISDKDYGRYYQQNRVATSELVTRALIARCDKALELAETNHDDAAVLHICSGLYALENEITAYGEKYAAAVKAFAIIDGVDKALSAMNTQAQQLANKNEKDIEQINAEIEALQTAINESIDAAYKQYAISPNREFPDCILKSLHLDGDSMHTQVGQKSRSCIEKLLTGWFFGFGKAKFSEKDKQEITGNIKLILSDYTNDFKKTRQKFLEDTKIAFLDSVKDAINKNGRVSEEAKQFMLAVRAPALKDVLALSEIGEAYDHHKRVDKFLWIETSYIEREAFIKSVDEKLIKITTEMTRAFVIDFCKTLDDLLKAIASEFMQNTKKYSILMQAKLADKAAVEACREKILAASSDLEKAQKELNAVIWRAKDDGK